MRLKGPYVSLSMPGVKRDYNLLVDLVSRVPFQFYIERALVNGRVVWFLIGGEAVPYIYSMKDYFESRGVKVRIVEKP